MAHRSHSGRVEHVGGRVHQTAGERVFPAETQIFTATYERDGASHTEKFVFRREPRSLAVYPEQSPGHDIEIDIQYRVMSALRQHNTVPVALIGYEADVSVLGAPFYVMGFIDGVVPIENPLYTTQGFFVDATPAQRRTMIENGLRALAQFHTLDPFEAGPWLVWYPKGCRPVPPANSTCGSSTAVANLKAANIRCSTRPWRGCGLVFPKTRCSRCAGVIRGPATSSGKTLRRRVSPTLRPCRLRRPIKISVGG